MLNARKVCIIDTMKPIKVMRYGNKYRYNSSKKGGSNILKIAIPAIILVAALTAFVVWRVSAVKPADTQDDTMKLSMTDGNPVQMELKTGDICMLTVPSAVKMSEVEFTSSDASVVRVDAAGHVDALKAGKATITAGARNFTAACDFTVTENPEPDIPEELSTAILANQDILAENMKKGTDNLYSLTVNRRTNVVTAYTYDSKGEYTVPVRAMVASCGTGGNDITVTGDFSIYFQEPWHPLYGDVYGMFVSGFEGPYLFHSVPYDTDSHSTLKTEEFNKLGEHASQGCVRMMAADVRWIFKYCPLNTPVHVIDADASADPLGKPKTIKVPDNVRWDPTDTDPYNPYIGKLPEINGAADAQIKKGEALSPMDGVTATDICGNDITDRVTVAGQVLSEKPGVYYLTYTVKDVFNQRVRVTRTVTVTE